MMLKDRVITALILLPLLLAAMFVAPAWVFQLVVAAAIIGAAWEWAGLMDCTRLPGRIAYTLIVATAIGVSAWWMHHYPQALVALVVIALVWWGVVAGWLGLRPHRQPEHGACLVKGVCGVLTLVPAFAAIVALHAWDDLGPQRLLFLFALVWLADVGAYFAGRRFGMRKLAPQVSPGKTWEGVYGAFAMSLLVIYVGWLLGLDIGPLWFFIPLCLLTVAVSIVGDLAESMFKRQQGVKDSGTLLPGHGGLLDRIDSLTSAAPLFVGGMLLAELLA